MIKFIESIMISFRECFNRFWSKFMPKLNRYEKSDAPDRIKKVKTAKAKYWTRKSLDATEGYVFCGVVATGVLQMISLRDAQQSEIKDFHYQRTPARVAVSEATVCDSMAGCHTATGRMSCDC